MEESREISCKIPNDFCTLSSKSMIIYNDYFQKSTNFKVLGTSKIKWNLPKVDNFKLNMKYKLELARQNRNKVGWIELSQTEGTISLYWLMKALKFKSSVQEGIKQNQNVWA